MITSHDTCTRLQDSGFTREREGRERREQAVPSTGHRHRRYYCGIRYVVSAPGWCGERGIVRRGVSGRFECVSISSSGDSGLKGVMEGADPARSYKPQTAWTDLISEMSPREPPSVSEPGLRSFAVDGLGLYGERRILSDSRQSRVRKTGRTQSPP